MGYDDPDIKKDFSALIMTMGQERPPFRRVNKFSCHIIQYGSYQSIDVQLLILTS